MNLKVIVTTALIITIIAAGIEIYHFTSPSAPTSEIRGKPKIISYTSYIENDTVNFFVIVGELQNNLTTNIKSVRINATFYDEEDYVIGTGYSYTELRILTPEQKTPFRIYWVLESLASIPARIELACGCLTTDEQPIMGINILKQSNNTDEDGYYIVSGEVQNDGPVMASAVKILCTYYDSEGDVIAVSDAYPTPSRINVGGKATFEVSSKPHKINPASYELSIVAFYAPIFDMRYPLFFILVAIFGIFIVYMKKRRGW